MLYLIDSKTEIKHFESFYVHKNMDREYEDDYLGLGLSQIEDQSTSPFQSFSIGPISHGGGTTVMDWECEDENLGLALPQVEDQRTSSFQGSSVDPIFHGLETPVMDTFPVDPGPSYPPNNHAQQQQGPFDILDSSIVSYNSSSTFRHDNLVDFQGTLVDLNEFENICFENAFAPLPSWDFSDNNYDVEMDILGLSVPSHWYPDEPDSLLPQITNTAVPPELFDFSVNSSQQMPEAVTLSPSLLRDHHDSHLLNPMPALEIHASGNNMGQRSVGDSPDLQCGLGESWTPATRNTCDHMAEDTKPMAGFSTRPQPAVQLQTQLPVARRNGMRTLKDPTTKDWIGLRPIVWALKKEHSIAEIRKALRDQHGFRTRRVPSCLTVYQLPLIPG